MHLRFQARSNWPRLIAAGAAALLMAAVMPLLTAGPARAAANLLANPGFEAGTTAGWTCSSLDSVVASPVHSGSHALAGAASSSDDAQCSQSVSVQPSTSYTLSGFVEGNYVFIGDSGTGSSDTNAWTPSATSWQQLSTTFTTGSSTTSVTIYVHGWYAEGTYFADDLSLAGPGGGGGGTAPGAPTGLQVTGTTSSSASLSWTAPSGSTVSGYFVYENGSRATSVTGTSVTISGLAASTTYTFAVSAFNSVGEGPQSASVQATTASSGGGGGGGGGPGSFAVAPYADMTNLQEPMLDKAATSAGLKAFTAAFVIGSGCTPIWGDTLPVTNDPMVTGEITKAESEGATPIVSFGGEAGVELAQSCTNLGSLVAAYQSVINTLHVNHIDFDIEGAAIADTATNNLRFQAINQLEAANPGLVVSVTIPTFPTGPDFNGDAFLQAAKSSGTNISVINVMAMDFYGSFDTGGANMGSYATEAAQDTLSFVKTIWPNDTYANIGVTPMIGQNDDSAEVFTEANAQTLVSFASSNHLGRLAFWSVDRDQACSGSASGLPSCSEISQQPLDFTKIFTKFTG
ncbi:MAG TPA: fibronectin type III domain-containing protein [Streptosporangiaceae bacterium]|nr:fibronectin type III domain-containing protein [Streptosporangiaceae bacterium]